MTWDELVEKIRKGQAESSSHLRALENIVTTVGKDNGDLSTHQVGIMVALLTLAVSNLHSTIEHMSIGLDAVVEALREATDAPDKP